MASLAGDQAGKSVVLFLLFGGLAAAVEFVVFLVLAHAGIPLIVAQVCSFMAGLMVSFFGNRKVTFRSEGGYARSSHKQFLAYGLLAVVNLALSSLLLSGLVYGLSLEQWLAKIAAMVMIACWNFAIFQKFIFKKVTN